MNKKQIEETNEWKALLASDTALRYKLIIGHNKKEYEKQFNVKIRLFSMEQVSDIPDDCAYITVASTPKDNQVAVFIPNKV
jgi:hypothetical protein